MTFKSFLFRKQLLNINTNIIVLQLLLQQLLAKGNLWTKEMEMRLTDNDVVLLDGETQVLTQTSH
jgi:hypothetical protein